MGAGRSAATIGGMGGEAAAERALFALFVAYVCFLPLRHAFVVPGFGISVGPPVALVLAGGWVVLVLVRGSVRRPHPFLVALGLFALLAGASLAWTIDASMTSIRFATLGYVLAVLVVAWDLLRTDRRLAIAGGALVLGVFVVGLVGVADVVRQGGLLSRRDVAHGVNANVLARWLVLAGPIAAGLLPLHRRGRGRRPGGTILAGLAVAYLALLPFMVLATGSRQGVVGLLVLGALGGFVLARRGRAIGLGRRSVVAGALFAGLFVVAVRRVATLGIFFDRLPAATSRLESLGGRTPIWEVGLEAFGARPLLGSGAGTYGALTPVGMSADPHNTVVGVAAELGLLGLVGFGLVALLPAVAVGRNPGPRYVSTGLLLALGTFATVAMLYTDVLYWLLLLFVVAGHAPSVAEWSLPTVGFRGARGASAGSEPASPPPVDGADVVEDGGTGRCDSPRDEE